MNALLIALLAVGFLYVGLLWWTEEHEMNDATPIPATPVVATQDATYVGPMLRTYRARHRRGVRSVVIKLIADKTAQDERYKRGAHSARGWLRKLFRLV